MESFLNILWVAMALAAFGVWRTNWLHQHRDGRREPLREWTAFACALVLLFFAVSLTDDLHSDLVIFDECSTIRRHSSALTGPHHALDKLEIAQASGAAILPARLTQSFHWLAMIVPVPEPSGIRLIALASSGRAPPALPI
jgi:hypothetical protein